MGTTDAVPAQGRFAVPMAPLAVTAGAAAITFLIAFDGGSFGVTSRGTLSVAVWWGLILAVAAGIWSLAGLDRTTVLVGGLLVAYAGLTLASVIWADDAEGAFEEFNRVALYVGIFALAALAARRSLLPRWTDGFALGIVAIAGLALFSRCFPDLIAGENITGLPLDLTRLSYPLGYWNGLAILVALAVPLLLRVAVSETPLALRALALAPFPVLAVDIYLASSRGGLVTAVVGTLALLALVPRMRTAEAIVLALAGAAAGIACIVTRDELVNHPGPDAAGQGHVVFPILLGACAGTALVAFLVFRYVAAPLERRTARLGTVARAVAVGVVVLLVTAGIVLAHPGRLFDRFTAPPAYTLNTLPTSTSNPIRVHLLSVGSSGRWQQWGSAVDEFRTAPGLGRGAGSYADWWAEHGTLRGFVKDAHSLYLESLGELGIVGFLLIVGAFVVAIVVGARRALAAAGEERLVIAAIWAGFVAYAFAAGIDWMWEMTAVSVVGIALLGLLTSRATAPRPEPEPRLRLRWNIAARVALGLAGLFVILAQGIALLTNREIQESQNAVARDDQAAAVKHADNARKIEPWASTPYQQLALLSEKAQEYDQAVVWIEKAIPRARSDWRPWAMLARFEAERGDIDAARRAVRRVCELNPRSDLFAEDCR